MCIAGLISFALSAYDLFGDKRLPVPLTVIFMLVGIASVFVGPALYFFGHTVEQRRKVARRSFWTGAGLVLSGLFFFMMHWPGVSLQVIIGVLLISLFYGALTVKNKYEKWKVYTNSTFDALFLSLFDFVGVGSFILGFLFKMQHWPMAEPLIIGGALILIIGVLAWNRKFKKEVVRRKETEDKLKDSYAEIETQHLKLEEKQKEIIDSINYAKRIQQTHMPTEKYIQSVLERLHKNK